MQKNFTRGEKKIIEGFKERIFLLKSDDKFKEQARHDEKEIKNIRNENGLIDYNEFMKLIKLKERKSSNELVRKYFLVQNLGDLLKNLKKFTNNPKEIEQLVNIIKSGLSDFKNEIKIIRRNEKKKLKNHTK